jgi:Tetratricopeptide repeat/Glycosyltransferase family 9 (heptosyltransferase)
MSNEQTLAAYDAMLAHNPFDAEVLFSKGVVLDDLARFDEALAAYQQALALNPEHAGASQNASTLLLARGDYAQGWRLYEGRWRLAQRGLSWQDLPRPVWRGEPLAGKHILVWSEQGFGDAFQFCRYVLVLHSMGAAKVTLLALEGRCKRLFEHSFAQVGIEVVSEVAIRNGLLTPAFDVHSPLMSLPFACGTDSVDKIPVRTPYLFAKPEDAAHWQARIASVSLPKQLRVGLCWAGGAKLGEDAKRSLALLQMLPLLRLVQKDAVQFFSLQLGEPAQQLQALPPDSWQGAPIIDLTPELMDWAHTAALIENLDLVISCDTAVAHLAAAMGKPTWILSRFSGCWRWLQDRDDSPWYPSVRLFRQTTAGDWAGVMDRVALALAAQIALPIAPEVSFIE